MAEDVSILQEIDEALRADKLQQFWARHSGTVITFCVLAVLASAGSVLWKNHQRQTHERQTGLLIQAVRDAQAGKYDEAIGRYEKIEEEGGSLATLAGVRHAQALIGMKHEDKALALYNTIAAGRDAPEALRDFAGLEAAILADNQALNAGKTPDVSAPGHGAYSQATAELNALRALKAGDGKSAATMLKGIINDDSAPFSQRARAAEFLDSIKEDKK